MAILPWQKNKEIDRFANLLADELYSRIQPDLASEYFNDRNASIERKKDLKNKMNKAQNVDQALGSVIAEFKKFRESEKLGIYGKARLHMKFMERLTELGYAQDIARKLNEQILFKTA